MDSTLSFLGVRITCASKANFCCSVKMSFSKVHNSAIVIPSTSQVDNPEQNIRRPSTRKTQVRKKKQLKYHIPYKGDLYTKY